MFTGDVSMDLLKALRELHEEKERLESAIASLELYVRSKKTHLTAASRRGRKFMSSEERSEVSARMRTYWAARRDRADQEKAS